MECKHCDGKGYNIEFGSDNMDQDQVPCQDCNGIGQVNGSGALPLRMYDAGGQVRNEDDTVQIRCHDCGAYIPMKRIEAMKRFGRIDRAVASGDDKPYCSWHKKDEYDGFPKEKNLVERYDNTNNRGYNEAIRLCRAYHEKKVAELKALVLCEECAKRKEKVTREVSK